MFSPVMILAIALGFAAAAAIDTTVTETSTTTTSTPASTATGTVPHYGQCGGIGYTGPTVCAEPYTCIPNSFYWQCL
ncbi:hypothetical protein FRB94_004171 [Tulasnella sp. JGI-2019a]|nr:hypothetical protein FRB93_003556 [Tulasnella sp. JGI-2019a]KAG9002021.1 hypothetical protein FRB94_004171 [Tulasnella sp. JGI-2019a]KAG9037283.1 hypothetical protein FRB95_006226 [Tulasnella sp. JGI-2019a]